MPSRWAAVVIVALWVGTTAMLVLHDVLPRLGYGGLNYRAVLQDRAIEEATQWSVFLDERPCGSVVTIVKPRPDGSFSLVGRVTLSSVLFDPNSSSNMLIRSDFHVSPLGRLRDFEIAVRIEGTPVAVDIVGEVERSTLKIDLAVSSDSSDESIDLAGPAATAATEPATESSTAASVAVDAEQGHPTSPAIGPDAERRPFFSTKMSIPIDPEMIVLDTFGPLDRLPDLRLGKQWYTRTINPVTTMLSPTNWLGGGKPAMDVIDNEVVDIETITFRSRPERCYRVEHRQAGVTVHTWARVEDGQVLRQEVPMRGAKVVMELNPNSDPRENSAR